MRPTAPRVSRSASGGRPTGPRGYSCGAIDVGRGSPRDGRHDPPLLHARTARPDRGSAGCWQRRAAARCREPQRLPRRAGGGRPAPAKLRVRRALSTSGFVAPGARTLGERRRRAGCSSSSRPGASARCRERHDHAAPTSTSARLVTSGGERGLLGLAFAPDFATSRLPVGHLHPQRRRARARPVPAPRRRRRRRSRLRRARTVLVVPHPTYANHNGGDIAFGPGRLPLPRHRRRRRRRRPVATTRRTCARCSGKMLRIDVRCASSGVLHPADQPVRRVDDGPARDLDGGAAQPVALVVRHQRHPVDRRRRAGHATRRSTSSPRGDRRAAQPRLVVPRGRAHATTRRGAARRSTYTAPAARAVPPRRGGGCPSTRAAEAIIGGYVYRGSAYPARRRAPTCSATSSPGRIWPFRGGALGTPDARSPGVTGFGAPGQPGDLRRDARRRRSTASGSRVGADAAVGFPTSPSRPALAPVRSAVPEPDASYPSGPLRPAPRHGRHAEHQESTCPRSPFVQPDGSLEQRTVADGTTAAELFPDRSRRRRPRRRRAQGPVLRRRRRRRRSSRWPSTPRTAARSLRHSTAHVLAQAVQQLFPEAKLGIGPPIRDGFYYDFDVERPFTPEDLSALEKRMQEIIKSGQRFSRRVVTEDDARAELAHEPYKLELIGLKGGVVRRARRRHGGRRRRADHLRQPRRARPASAPGATCAAARTCPTTRVIPAFKLMRSAAAYWRGSEKNPHAAAHLRHRVGEPRRAQGAPARSWRRPRSATTAGSAQRARPVQLPRGDRLRPRGLPPQGRRRPPGDGGLLPQAARGGGLRVRQHPAPHQGARCSRSPATSTGTPRACTRPWSSTRSTARTASCARRRRSTT